MEGEIDNINDKNLDAIVAQAYLMAGQLDAFSQENTQFSLSDDDVLVVLQNALDVLKKLTALQSYEGGVICSLEENKDIQAREKLVLGILLFLTKKIKEGKERRDLFEKVISFIQDILKSAHSIPPEQKKSNM